MIRSVAKAYLQAFMPLKTMVAQPNPIVPLQLELGSSLSSRITFGFTTKDEKGKKEQKEKPKEPK